MTALQPETTSHPSLEHLTALLEHALQLGAEHADIMALSTRQRSATCRLSALESSEHAETFTLGLRVFKDFKQALVSFSDKETITRQNIEDALARASAMPRDDTNCLPSGDTSSTIPDATSLDLCDPSAPSPQQLIVRAQTLEQAALDVDGITNSEGALAHWTHKTITLVASNGLRQHYETSQHGFMLSVLAGEGVAMQRDYDYQNAVYADDLDALTQVGKETAARACQRLNPRKIASEKMAVVYDPRVAMSLLSHLASGLYGDGLARGTSFLRESLGKKILSDKVTIIDDPLRGRGLNSRPCDVEGTPSQTRTLVMEGVLQSFLLDHRSGLLMNQPSTGHAHRKADSQPSAKESNLTMQPGKTSPQDLIQNIKRGFYVTELLGLSLNINNGDYSRGASGFLIENGTLTDPLAEMTIAGNLKDMFQAMTPANDLRLRYGIDAPTCVIESMTVGGK